MITIGLRIRRIRQQRLLSQQQLSQITNIQKSRLGRIERGETKLAVDELVAISKALNVKVEQLL